MHALGAVDKSKFLANWKPTPAITIAIAISATVSVSPFFSVRATVPSISVSISVTMAAGCALARGRCRPAARRRTWRGCRRRRDVHLDGQQQRTGGGQPARNPECTLHPWRDQATNSWSRHIQVARRDSARAVICRRQVATFRSKSRQCLHISLYISSKSPKISARFSDYVSHPRHFEPQRLS